MQVFGDLAPRLPRAHHQHRAGRELIGVLVGGRVDLHDRVRQPLGVARHVGAVVAADRQHDVGGRVIALARRQREGAVGPPPQRGHVDAFAQRRLHGGGEVLDVADDGVLGHEAVRLRPGIGEVRQAALPVRRDQAEAVPALGPPSVADPVALEHQVVEAPPFEEVTDRKAGLAAADHGDRQVGNGRDGGNEGLCHGRHSSKASTSTTASGDRGWRAAAARIARISSRARPQGKP